MAKERIYDPLVDKQIDENHAASVQTHWQQTLADAEAPPSEPLADSASLVVIGAGYTGLNAALTLARVYDKQVIVLEAGEVGSGCSSRNAGFVLPGSGRLGIADYKQRFGETVAQAVQREFQHSVEYVQQRIESASIQCDWAPGRYLRVAHSERQAQLLQQQPQPYLSSAQLKYQLPGLRHCYGALQQEPAASVHPKALVHGYAREARAAGVTIHSRTPVQQWQHHKDGELLTTPRGSVLAKQVLVCSNAYTASALLPQLTSRQLPALSSILVTAPLTIAQREATGLTCRDLIMDTRALKYYYRLLPDNRLLFGGRGAISGRRAHHPGYKKTLIKALETTWPCLQGIGIASYWHGWVSVALDSMPRVFSLNERIHASMGYCGAGIAFASLAGQRLAQRVMGEELPLLPFYQSALPHYPAPGLRRVAQSAYYQYAKIKDRLS